MEMESEDYSIIQLLDIQPCYMALICLLVPYKYNNNFMSGIVIKTLHGCFFCVYSALQDIKQYTER